MKNPGLCLVSKVFAYRHLLWALLVGVVFVPMFLLCLRLYAPIMKDVLISEYGSYSYSRMKFAEAFTLSYITLSGVAYSFVGMYKGLRERKFSSLVDLGGLKTFLESGFVFHAFFGFLFIVVIAPLASLVIGLKALPLCFLTATGGAIFLGWTVGLFEEFI